MSPSCTSSGGPWHARDNAGQQGNGPDGSGSVACGSLTWLRVIAKMLGVNIGGHLTYGSVPYGSAPYGGLPSDFRATFDLEKKDDSLSIVEVASFVDRGLIERLRRFPDDLRIINRRKFEELVAEFFVGFGYEVELTQRTRDGGKDIIAIRRQEVDTRFLIECKRPDPGNPVGVSTVRELYGVKVHDGASKAILATTTYFTLDARIFFDTHRWELEPRDFDALQAWIVEYLRRKGR